jgi:hypothetical protein
MNVGSSHRYRLPYSSHAFAVVVALCWIADRPAYEVLINGFKRGVSPKHRFRDKSRSENTSSDSLIST